MDEFTVGVLIEWGFEELIDTFKDEEIGKDDFLSLTELMVKELIPKMGKRSSFYSKLTRLKEIQIEIDFQTLYPGKDKLLFHKFDVFKVKLIKYIDKLNKRFSLQDESTLLSELKTPSRLGNDNISVLKLLPQLFQPLTIKLDKKRKRDGKHSIWRPSKAEQADSFVLFIPDVAELRNVHAQKIEKAVQYGTTLQSYIIIVDNTDIYAVINSIYYKLETPLKALDVCYKSYFALNLNYPQESEQIWLFIQNYFFDTTLKSDKHVLFVKTFINDLKNM
ncbi:uncharacterized protein LOC132943397 [Metopolophium dirhodum]|uniref:uncharacterized protein LOC132943397 n=1 Tax=Metopolophium dirhodum TaxID=44670 RepID=UPI00298F9CA0|nr:uncharacterized protein LOC132943397 [Metopolophium dirhodum]